MNEVVNKVQETISILKEFIALWPNSRKWLTEEDYHTIKMYAVKLVSLDIPPDIVRAALNILSEKEIFYPPLARIIAVSEGLIKKAMGKRILDADEAWNITLEAIKRGERIVDDPNVHNALNYIGGSYMIAYCHINQVPALRAQFREGYNLSVQRNMEDKVYMRALDRLPDTTKQLILSVGNTTE